MASATRPALCALALLLAAGCATRPWADQAGSQRAGDIAAIETAIERVNHAFAIGSVEGLTAMAVENYFVVFRLATSVGCIQAWQRDPSFWSYLHDTLDRNSVTATPADRPPGIDGAPVGREYVFSVKESARFNGESVTTPLHETVEHYHATVLPDGRAVFFISCTDETPTA